MPSFTQEAQNSICSQPLAFQRTLSFLVPNVNLTPGCLSFLQSNFPFTLISSSISCYILYFTYYCRHLRSIFLWFWGTSGKSIKWRRDGGKEMGKRKSILSVLEVEAVVGVQALNSSEHRLSRCFYQIIILESEITTEHFFSKNWTITFAICIPRWKGEKGWWICLWLVWPGCPNWRFRFQWLSSGITRSPCLALVLHTQRPHTSAHRQPVHRSGERGVGGRAEGYV